MSGDLNVGKLTGEVELEDNFTSKLDRVLAKIGEFDEKLGGMGSRILENAAGFFTAESALEGFKEAAHLAAETLAELTVEGSHAADIEETFDRLTEKAGVLGDVLLEKASKGVRGTVTEMDLMTRVNQNLAVGLNLTEAQMETVTNAAFSLAKATGGNVTEALDRVSTAMVTGRVRAVQLLTGKIDLASAEQKFAASLGTTTDHLSASGKQAAIQAIILEKLESATDRVGEQHVRLADKITQAKTRLANFEEEVGTAIATSPVITALVDGLGEAFDRVFDSSTGVEDLAKGVDHLAIVLVDKTETIVKAMRAVQESFLLFRVSADPVGVVVEKLSDKFSLFGKTLGALSTVQDKATDLWSRLMHAITGAEPGKLTTLAEELDKTKKKMEEAAKIAFDGKNPIRDLGDAHDRAGEQAAEHAAAIGKDGYVMLQTAEEAKKFAEAIKELDAVGGSWEQTLNTVNGEIVEAVKYYLDAGIAADKLAAAYELTQVQVKAIETAHKEGLKAIKDEADAEKILNDVFTERATLYETDSVKLKRKALADYDNEVASAQARGVVVTAYYDALWAKMEVTIEKSKAQRAIESAGTREHYAKLALEAREAYEDATRGVGTYTAEGIAVLHQKMVEANTDLLNWHNLADKAMDATVNGAKNATIAVSKLADQVLRLDGQLQAFDKWKAEHDAGGSVDVTSSNFGQVVDTFNHQYDGVIGIGTPPKINADQAFALAKQGYSWSEIMKILFGGNTSPGPPAGPRIPGFKDGSNGVVDFGEGTIAMLHGREAVVKEGNGLPGAGGIAIHVSGVWDPSTVSKMADALSRELASRTGIKFYSRLG